MCVYPDVCVCMSVHVSVYMCTYIYHHECVCMYACGGGGLCVRCMHVCVYVCMCVCAHVCARVRVCVCACVYVCVRACASTSTSWQAQQFEKAGAVEEWFGEVRSRAVTLGLIIAVCVCVCACV